MKYRLEKSGKIYVLAVEVNGRYRKQGIAYERPGHILRQAQAFIKAIYGQDGEYQGVVYESN
jgi:hypothetical protein